MSSVKQITFPRRKLGLQTLRTEKTDQLCIKRLALIAVANLIPSDTLGFAKGTIIITANTDEHLMYDFVSLDGQIVHEVVTASQVMDSAILTAFQKKIPELSPAYTHPLCQVLERDPAIYRLRTQAGWVIHDTLSLMTGNVAYPVGPGVGLRSVSDDEAFLPVDTATQASEHLTEQINTEPAVASPIAQTPSVDTAASPAEQHSVDVIGRKNLDATDVEAPLADSHSAPKKSALAETGMQGSFDFF